MAEVQKDRAPIARELKELGVDAWYDSEISAGESFGAVVRDSLKEAKAVHRANGIVVVPQTISIKSRELRCQRPQPTVSCAREQRNDPNTQRLDRPRGSTGTSRARRCAAMRSATRRARRLLLTTRTASTALDVEPKPRDQQMHLTVPSHWSRSIGMGGRDPSERVVTIVAARSPTGVSRGMSRDAKFAVSTRIGGARHHFYLKLDVGKVRYLRITRITLQTRGDICTRNKFPPDNISRVPEGQRPLRARVGAL